MNGTKTSAIPKDIHVVWIGDDAARPVECIETWKQKNPQHRVRVWDNRELHTNKWQNWPHMKQLMATQIYGVADMMRWEILYRFGGFAIDADAICVRPLDDWLFELEAFACWENELARPGLISNAFVATVPNNEFFAHIILDIGNDFFVPVVAAWQSVGPVRLTQSYHKYRYANLTLLPSHFFMPRHFTGIEYTGGGVVYGQQQWASTKTLMSAAAAAGRDGQPG